MVLFTVLIITLIIATITLASLILAGGIGFITLFGDGIVFIAIIVGILKLLTRKNNKK